MKNGKKLKKVVKKHLKEDISESKESIGEDRALLAGMAKMAKSKKK